MTDVKFTVRLPPLIIEKDMGGFTIGFFGSSKSGKTTLMMELYKQKFDKAKYIATLFSVNSQIDAYNGTKYLLKTSQFGIEEARYIRAQKYVNSKTDNKYNFMILLDDFIDIRHSQVLNNLILTYRNSNISTMICLQYVRLLSKQARGNINSVLFFYSNSEEARLEIIKIYLGSLFRKLGIAPQGWDEAYQYYTRDHAYLYLHIATSTLWSSRKNEYLLR